MKSPRLFAIAALVALTGCSLLFDPGDLGRRAQPADAPSEGGGIAPIDASTVAVGEAGQDALAPRGDEPSSASAPDAQATVDAEEDREASNARPDAAVAVEAGAIEVAAIDAPAEAASAMDAPAEAASSPVDAAVDATPPVPDAGPGTLSVGLVAYYAFDESSGTTASDGSGNGQTALMKGATFTPGRLGNAATMDGNGQYVTLPVGIMAGLTSCSISLWVNLASASALIHLFDFGSGTTTYMSLSSSKFAITLGNLAGEEKVAIPTLTTAVWHHVVLTLAGSVATVYVDGQAIAHNSSMTLTPSSLGMTTQNWIGKSQDPTDLFLSGKVDQFRIYGRALTATEIQQLYLQKL